MELRSFVIGSLICFEFRDWCNFLAIFLFVLSLVGQKVFCIVIGGFFVLFLWFFCDWLDILRFFTVIGGFFRIIFASFLSLAG